MINKLWLLSSVFLCLTANASFTDQANIPSWGNQAVQDLVTAEIISGNADGSLAPWRSINRAEFLKILTIATGVNIVQSSGKNFPDVPVNAWFSPYVHTAVSLGWAKGYPDGTFGPGNLINRAEIAKLLSEAWKLPLEIQTSDTQWFDIYLRSLETGKALPYATTLDRFDPGRNPSRIEVFEQLHRTWDTEEEEEVIIPAIIEETEVTTKEAESTEEDSQEEAIDETETSTSADETAEETTSESGSEEEPEPAADTEAEEETAPSPDAEVIDEEEPDLTALEIESLSEATTQIIYPGQGGITGFVARLTPMNGSPVIKSLTFTHSGNAPVTNFSRMWLYDDNERISDEIIPNGGTNVLQFIPELRVSETTDIYLKLDTPSGAEPGYTSRWNILSVDTAESTTDTSLTNFPINGQWLEIHPE